MCFQKSNMFYRFFVQNQPVHRLLKRSLSSFDSKKLTRIHSLKSKHNLVKSLLASNDLLDLSALEVDDVFLMFRSMRINVNDSALKASGVDGEVLSFVKSNSDLEELGITLPRAKYAVFVKNMKQFKSKGVPTSFLYGHRENKPFLSGDDTAWDEIDGDKANSFSSCKDKKQELTSHTKDGATKPATVVVSSSLNTILPEDVICETNEDDLMAKISSLSLQKSPSISLLEGILRDIQGEEGRDLSIEAAAEACMQVTHCLLQCQIEKRGAASSRLCLEIIMELCHNRSRAITFCAKDEAGICSKAILSILSDKESLVSESLTTDACRVLELLTQSGAALHSADDTAGVIVKVLSTHPKNADIITACCETLLSLNKNYKMQIHWCGSAATKALETVLDFHKGDLRVAGTILNTLHITASSDLVMQSQIPKLLVEVLVLHSSDLHMVNAVGRLIARACCDSENVAVFIRCGAVEKLCAVLPEPSLLDILFDDFYNRKEHKDIEHAINKLCASSPRNRLQVETLLGQERADKICEC